MAEKSSIGYDIIGDVHGHCDALKTLLSRMGYVEDGGSYRHPSRKAIFVGDLIDRGPKVRETLELVKAMHNHGSALVTIGNHEYNAVAFCTRGEDGEWLRPHTQKNIAQFEATQNAFSNDDAGWRSYLGWFRSLPLFLDLGAIRVVHACWSERHIHLVGGRRLNDSDFLRRSTIPGTPEFQTVETLLKGPEVSLPDGCSFQDKSGVTRTKTRVKWWQDLDGVSYREASFPEQPSLPDSPIHFGEALWDVYPLDDPPVFVGHYWLPPQTPHPYQNVVCLDYSVAKDGFLTAYRWSPGESISKESFVVAATLPTT